MHLKSKLILLLAVVTAASVVGYNLWLYRCGCCTVRSLITPSAPGYLLFALNILLGLSWLALKRNNVHRARRHFCPCGRQLLAVWRHCPDCGRKLRDD